MKMPSKGLMSTLGGMAKNYGSRHAMGLTMFGAGAVGASMAARNSNANGIGVGNSLVGLAGMGLMAAGGRSMGAQRLLSASGRGRVSAKIGSLGRHFKGNGYHRTAGMLNKAASYGRRTTRF